MSRAETVIDPMIIEYLGGSDYDRDPITIDESAIVSSRRLEEIRTDRAIKDAIRARIQSRRNEINDLGVKLEAHTNRSS